MAAAVCDGDSVILDVNGEKKSFVRVKGSGTIKVGKFFVPATPLIGAPYGAMFEVFNGQSLQRVASAPDDGITRVTDTEKDNSHLHDRNTENQKLTQQDVEQLKRSGKGGSEIVEALCSNSATFSTKTEFAQDKYKRKKQKKYCTYVTLRRPTARAICEAYFEKAPERIWNLRFDSLAVVLSLANVAAGAKVLVLENCLGLLTAAVAERLGGYGHVCGTSIDKLAPLDAVKLMNLTLAQRTAVCSASLATLTHPQASSAAVSPDQPLSTAVPMQSDDTPQPPASSTSSAQASEQGTTCEGNGTSTSNQGAPAETWRGYTATPSLVSNLVQSGFTSCIIAYPKTHPVALLQHIWPLLSSSASFVVFSPWIQPLAECLHHLQTSKQAVLLQLQESWLRPSQVLPARTHPHMTCTGTAGYILSGTKVVCTDSKPLGFTAQQAGTTTESQVHSTHHNGSRNAEGQKRRDGFSGPSQANKRAKKW